MSQTTITTALAIGLAGQLSDTLDHDVLSVVNAEGSAEIPFGVMLGKGTADNDGKLLASSADTLIGVMLLSFVYDNGPNGSLGTVGVKPKSMMNVLRQGRCYVVVEEAVNAYDRAYVRYAAGAGGTVLGGFRKSSVANETIDARKQVQYLTSAAAGGIACIAVDMLNS